MKREHMYHRDINLFLNGRRVYEDAPAGAGAQAGGGAGGSGASGGAAGEGGKGVEEMVSKGEHEKVLGELEELRNEVLSPEYLEFLAAKDKPKDTPPAKTGGDVEVIPGLTAAQVDAMSKADIVRHMAKLNKEEAEKAALKVRDELTSGERENVRKEIAAFARTHADFEKYRPAMHGLSLDPKNADLTLDELYAKAKEIYPSGPTKEEKERAAKLRGEKPGGANDSYDRLKKLTPDEAAREALKETKEAMGIETIPTA